jgi:hypothetical protein
MFVCGVQQKNLNYFELAIVGSTFKFVNMYGILLKVSMTNFFNLIYVECTQKKLSKNGLILVFLR